MKITNNRKTIGTSPIFFLLFRISYVFPIVVFFLFCICLAIIHVFCLFSVATCDMLSLDTYTVNGKKYSSPLIGPFKGIHKRYIGFVLIFI